MKRGKTRDWLWIAMVFVFALCVTEGFVYYYETENLFLRVSLNLQNIIKAFKLDPDIKQVQAVEFLKMHRTDGMDGILLEILTYAYCVAVLLAPFCTMAALFALIRGPYAFLKGMVKSASIKQHRLLVLGSGEDYEEFLNSLSNDCNVTTVMTEAISGDKRISYMERGISAKTGYRDGRDWLKKNRELSQYSGIVLCDENDLIDYEMAQIIVECQNNCLKNDSLDVYVCMNNTEWAEKIEKLRCPDDKSIRFIPVNINEKAANKMLMDYPIYDSRINENRDVHIGIVGFGVFGQNILISALNMAVLSADSKIRVDVYDRSVKNCLDYFLTRFSTEATDIIEHKRSKLYGDEEVNEYILKFPHGKSFRMDGTVEIHFWETDILNVQFKKAFEKCNEDMPFSYVVVTLGKQNDLISLILNIERTLNPRKDSENRDESKGGEPKKEISQDSNNKATIIFVIQDASDLDRKEKAEDIGVSFFGRDKTVFSYEALQNKTLIKNAIRFHGKYNDLSSGRREKVSANEESDVDEKHFTEWEEAWKNINGNYKRQSTLYQSMNQDNRKWIMIKEKQKQKGEEELKEILSKIEHRRWVIYQITHGWRYDEKRDDNKKLHDCICTWEDIKKNKPDTMEYDYIPFKMITDKDLEDFKKERKRRS
ncbi:hypothetical protein [[Clostridium] aminophilum]|nr:hypothetical protein [[Clostridium] aminophilum]